MSCSTLCTKEIPVYSIDSCGIITKKGGISYLVFAKCNAAIPYSDPCDQTLWDALIADCSLRITGQLVGSKAATSYTKMKVSSCLSEQVTGGEQTIVFKDYNSSLSNTTYDFYNAILASPSAYLVGWVNCTGELYGFYPFTIEASEVIDEDFKGTTHFEGSIMIQEKTIIKPTSIPSTLIPALLDFQNYSCELNDYVVDQATGCEDIFLSTGTRNLAIDSTGGPVAEVITINRGSACTTGALTFTFTNVPAGMTIGETQVLATNTLAINTVATPVGVYYIGYDATHATCPVSGNFFIVTVS